MLLKVILTAVCELAVAARLVVGQTHANVYGFLSRRPGTVEWYHDLAFIIRALASLSCLDNFIIAHTQFLRKITYNCALFKKNRYICNYKKYTTPLISTTMTIGIVISTYNNPTWLEKTLWGYLCQTRRPDEIVIADDGSDHRTRDLIGSFADKLPIKHVWHEDRGFQKSQILNKALLAAESDYLIFTDQDCVPRADFVATHERYARPGHFISGGYFKLPMDISIALTSDDVRTQRAFTLRWLKAQGMKMSWKCSKLLGNVTFKWLMNNITPARASWNGCNSSGWRTDMLAINGYNEEMQYGGQDREFGERLVNFGVRPLQRRYSAIVLHLDHKRPYRTAESIAKNKAIRARTRRLGIVRTPHGIDKL